MYGQKKGECGLYIWRKQEKNGVWEREEKNICQPLKSVFRDFYLLFKFQSEYCLFKLLLMQ